MVVELAPGLEVRRDLASVRLPALLAKVDPVSA
jgi:hypothetical protein